MAKADNAVKALQRRLGRLARLEGTLVRTAEGPVLLAQVEIRDPFALLAACEAAGPRALADPPSLAALRAGLKLHAEPERLTATRVARAHRDLLALAALPWLALVRAAPRHFRGLGPLDEQWLAARAVRIETLARVLRPEPAAARSSPGPGGPREPVPPAFAPVLGLVADLHGA
ncbi:MAG: hypothetical protein H0T76_23320, partial [Nannocystis sp.]